MNRKGFIRPIAILLISLMMITLLPTQAYAAKKPAIPGSVKMTYNRKYPAGSGLQVYLKWKKVSKADGYQVQIIGKTAGSDGFDMRVRDKKRITKKTKMRLFAGGTCKWIKARVRAYRIVNGKKVYGKWSAYKKKSSFR